MDANLRRIAWARRLDVLDMICAAGTGHIGGDMSCMDILVCLYYRVMDTQRILRNAPDRDRLFLSKGHNAEALYAVLSDCGFFHKNLLNTYAKMDTALAQHPTRKVPGVEAATGSLGHGLALGVGTALGLKESVPDAHVYVLMGDGEQSKGQIQEAIELAAKYRLFNLTAIVDMNGQQSSGATQEVLEVPVAQRYLAAGWNVIPIHGHDHEQIRQALDTARQGDMPTCILARTVMGKGIPRIENDWRYHGKRLSQEEAAQAIQHLDHLQKDLPRVRLPLRPWAGAACRSPVDDCAPLEGCHRPRTYDGQQEVDGRKACANALTDLAAANPGGLCVLDCDLASGLGIGHLNEVQPHTLIQCGIQEHNAVSTAGGVASCGVVTFFMDFGVFAMAEPFNQLRVLDQNHIPLKVVATHCGLDVGQDGKSHQFLDYIALANALLGFEMILPADPNQTDRALRYLAQTDRPGIVAVPRSIFPVLTDDQGEPLFGEDYTFSYGKADWLRQGSDAAIVTYGIMAQKALKAAAMLDGEGISCAVLNVACPKSLDEEKIRRAAATGFVLVAEDHNRASGLGAMLAAFMAERGIVCGFRRIGVERYGISASPEAQFRVQGMRPEDLADAVRQGYRGKEENHELIGH